MRKWTYLVAMLMLAGATTTFTGCIDTDEPAGIEELRGAKAELLRAKAKVEAARVAQVEAEAALKNAEAKAKEAEAQAALLKAEYEAAIAQQMSEAEIAKIQAEIAKIQAETNLYLTQAEAARQAAEVAHQQALIELQGAMAQLVGEQAKAVAKLKKNYEDAVNEYNDAYLAYVEALNGYNDAITDLESDDADEISCKRALENELNGAKDQLAHAKNELAMLNEELANAETMTESDLQVRYHELVDESKALEDSLAVLDLEKAQIRYNNIAEYEKWDALNDSMSVDSTFVIAAYKNDSAKGNSLVIAAMAGVDGVSAEGEFSYAKTNAKLDTNGKFDSNAANGYEATLGLIETWIQQLKDSTNSENDLANDSLLLPDLKDAVADADTTHQDAVAAWEILVNAKKGVKTDAPTKKVDDAVSAYNTEFATFAPVVKAYNDAVDSLKVLEAELGDAAYAEMLQKKQDKYYAEAGYDSIMTVTENADKFTTAVAAFNGIGKDKLDKETFDALVKSDSLKTLIAADAKKVYEAYLKGDKHDTDSINAYAAAFGTEEAKEALKDALEAIEDAEEDVEDLKITKWAAVKSAFAAYKTTLANDYGQILAGKNLTKYDGSTAVGSKEYNALNWANIVDDLAVDSTAAYAKLQNKAGVADSIVYVSKSNTSLEFGNYIVPGTDVTAAELANLTAGKLDKTTTNTAWEAKSYAAWGAGDRMVALAEDEVIKTDDASTEDIDEAENTFWLWIKAKEDLAAAEAGFTINPVFASLIEDFEAQKAIIEAQVKAAQAAVAESEVAWLAQKDVIDALEKTVTDKIAAVNRVQTIVEQLEDAYFIAINQLGDNTSANEIKALIADLKGQIVDAEQKIYSAETLVMCAEQALADADSEDNLAAVAAERLLAAAEYAMKQAEAKVERALSYLEAALEALKNATAAE